MDRDEQFLVAIERLTSSKSKDRRGAAIVLAKLQDQRAGEALLAALQVELSIPDAWASQYRMILALGFCRHSPAEPLLWDLASRDLEHTTLYIGVGDALVRIAAAEGFAEERMMAVLRGCRYSVVGGALCALALLKVVPTEEHIQEILGIAEDPAAREETKDSPSDPAGLMRWAAVAAANWPKELVTPFLERALLVDDSRLRMAAGDALKGRARKWNPY